MVESLLYPKKLASPLGIIMNPAAMFGEIALDNGKKQKVSLINAVPAHGAASIRFLNLSYVDYPKATLRLGLLMPVNQTGSSGSISLPFQPTSVENIAVSEYRCHGWSKKYADITSEPERTVSKQVLSHKAFIRFKEPDLSGADKGSGHLFNLYGKDLENLGNKPQFRSIGTWTALSYEMESGFFDVLSSEFDEIFQQYGGGTQAIEIVIGMQVTGTQGPDGFAVSLAIF